MKQIAFILFLVIFTFSCGNNAESVSEESKNMDFTSTEADAEAPAAGLVSTESQAKSDLTFSVSNNAVSTDSTINVIEQKDSEKKDIPSSAPLLIKTGYLTVEVKDYKDYRAAIQNLVSKNGGYIGNETESNETYRISNDIVIRVPAKAFDKIMSGLMEQGLKTDSKRIEVQDVGEEYADLQARIITKKAIEKRYLDILNKATKISDILEVEEKLRVIREETEAAQGRVKYLSNQVSYSTINLSFYKVLDTNYTPPSGPGFLSRIWKGVVKGWEGILEFIIAMVYLWPLWVVISIVILFIRRAHWKLKFWPFRKKES